MHVQSVACNDTIAGPNSNTTTCCHLEQKVAGVHSMYYYSKTFSILLLVFRGATGLYVSQYSRSTLEYYVSLGASGVPMT